MWRLLTCFVCANPYLSTQSHNIGGLPLNPNFFIALSLIEKQRMAAYSDMYT